MSNVTDLSAFRKQREIEDSPYLAGGARCLSCKHEWTAVTPVGSVDDLECPSCGLYRGVIKANCMPKMVAFCDACGESVFHLTPSGACCLNCGTTLAYSELIED